MDRWEMNKYVQETLNGLKDFQRATVEYIYNQFEQNKRTSMLVADEVGLGKTLVAKGFIANILKGKKRQHKPLKVTYICSNQVIANENMRKLNIFPAKFHMLPQIHRIAFTAFEDNIDVYKSHQVQKRLIINTLTPATSFNVSTSLGIKEERALIFALLFQDKTLKKHKTGLRWILKGNVENIKYHWANMHYNVSRSFKPGLQKTFIKAIKKEKLNKSINVIYDTLPGWRQRSLYDAVLEYSDIITSRPLEKKYHNICLELIKRLRKKLNETCLNYIDSDIYILDEFQRFRDLIDPDSVSEEAELAKQIFGKTNVKVLLLSATPFKAYSHFHEVDQGEEHYKDFLKVLKYLLQNDKSKLAEYEKHRKALYSQLMQLRDGQIDLNSIHKEKVEAILRSVMVRTERSSVTVDPNILIHDVWKHDQLPFSEGDIISYKAADQLYKALEELGYNPGKPIDYVKSALFPFSYLEHYKVRKILAENIDSVEVNKFLKSSSNSWVNYETVNNYSFSPGEQNTSGEGGNARLQLLIDKTIEKRSAELLWVPPSLPYYDLGGAFKENNNFTKTLVFSSWIMVPRMISTMLSYEVERRTVGNPNTISDLSDSDRKYFRTKPSPSPLLQWKIDSTENHLPSTMNNFTLLYPSRVLIDAINLQINIEEKQSYQDIIKNTANHFDELIKKSDLLHLADPKGESRRWYWAAPILLDQFFTNFEKTNEWLNSEIVSLASSVGSSAELEHLRYLQQSIENPKTIGLGPVPNDLGTILAEMAVASPANVVYRSLSNMFKKELGIKQKKEISYKVARYFRDLFNKPESITAIRLNTEKAPYWRRVLQYGGLGCLQAVIDEYLHLIKDQIDDPQGTIDYFNKALSLKATPLSIDSLDSFRGKIDKRMLRTHYAVELGGQKIETEDGKKRAINVRELFNSPFRPFVLSTTSIGQEGLDFHTYCRRIVHWNLPGNPVDLEQREGRINRYKGLVIRRSLAEKYRNNLATEDDLSSLDIWNRLFQIADKEERINKNKSELIPYWHLDDVPIKYKIERVIPMYPFSKEQGHLSRLLQMLAVYRLAFGQPRQTELVNHLLNREFTQKELNDINSTLMINLSPLVFANTVK